MAKHGVDLVVNLGQLQVPRVHRAKYLHILIYAFAVDILYLVFRNLYITTHVEIDLGMLIRFHGPGILDSWLYKCVEFERAK